MRAGETFDSPVCRRRAPRVEACPRTAARKGSPCSTSSLLLVCAVVIYLACEWFVNAVEWLGVRLQVGPVAVGTILAAAGTALPESVVTLVAVLFGSPESGAEVGIGAALGGPLVVGTIAYGVTGAMLLWRRRHAPRPVAVHAASGLESSGRRSCRRSRRYGTPTTSTAPTRARLARDQVWFLVIFAAKVALGLVAFAIKPWLGLLFLAAYAVYFRREIVRRRRGASGEGLEPLRFQPRARRAGRPPPSSCRRW